MKLKVLLTVCTLNVLSAEICTYISQKCLIQRKRETGSPEGPFLVKEGDFAFVVVVMSYVLQVNWTFCTGSLIKPNRALTAAHCVIFSTKDNHIVVASGKISSLKEYFVLRRRSHFEDAVPESTGITEIRVKKRHLHPIFSYEECDNDIAVLDMEDRFPRILDLTTVRLNFDKRTKMSCTTVGWGKVGLKNEYRKMSYMNNLSVSTPELGCKKRSEGKYLCAAVDAPLNCICDSGGPVVCNGEVYGVASHIFPLAFIAEDKVIGKEVYFTDLYYFKYWIASIKDNANLMSSLPVLCIAIIVFSLMEITMYMY